MTGLPEEDATVRTLLADTYGLSTYGVRRIARDSPNQVFRVDSQRGTYTVKRLARPASAGWLAFQASVTDVLGGKGFPIQPLLPALDGATTVLSGSHQWQVRPYAEGRAFVAGDPDDVEAAARVLDELHGGFAGVGGDDARSPVQDAEHWLAADEHELHVLAATARRVCPDGYPPERHTANVETFHRARAELAAAGYDRLPARLTHGEFIGSNVLYDGRRIACVLDWDAVQLRPRVCDLARGCFFFARRERGRFDVHGELVLRFLRHATAAEPMSPGERHALIPYLELYLLPTPDYLGVLARNRPDMLRWYLDWSATGAATARRVLAPVLDTL